MSKKLTTKSAIETALVKDIEAPDEVTGLVLYQASVNIKDDEEFSEKRALSEKDLTPTEAEMDLINASARMAQDAGNWYVFRNVNVTGPLGAVDAHGDVFSMRAAKTMADQVTPNEASPIITDHWHDLGDKPPVGKAIFAKASSKGLLETWAIPKEDYNSNIVKGLLNGTINKISIGAYISPADKICNSCETKSIYSVECPHIPLRNDEKGNLVTVTIKDVKRYAERSLVNIPARLGTSVKGLAPTLQEIDEELKEKLDSSIFEKGGLLGIDENPFTPTVTIDKSLLLDNLTDVLADLKPFTKEDMAGAMKKAIEDAFPPEDKSVDTPVATISPVIKEELVVTEKANEKAPEAQEPVEKEETPDTEAPAAEDPAQAPEQKSIEIPVVKELEVEELTKSFKLEVDALNKSLTEANEKFVKLAELQEKTDKDLGALTDTVKTIAEHVVKLAEFSTEEAINTLLEVAGQLKEQKAEAPKPAPDFKSFVDTLVAKK